MFKRKPVEVKKTVEVKKKTSAEKIAEALEASKGKKLSSEGIARFDRASAEVLVELETFKLEFEPYKQILELRDAKAKVEGAKTRLNEAQLERQAAERTPDQVAKATEAETAARAEVAKLEAEYNTKKGSDPDPTPEQIAEALEAATEVTAKRIELLEQHGSMIEKAPDSAFADAMLENPTTATGKAVKAYYETVDVTIADARLAGEEATRALGDATETALSKTLRKAGYVGITLLILTSLGLMGALIAILKKGNGGGNGDGGTCYQTFSNDPSSTVPIKIQCSKENCNCFSSCGTPSCSSVDGIARGVLYTWLPSAPKNFSVKDFMGNFVDNLKNELKTQKTKKSSSVFTIIICVVIAAALCGAGFIGYKMYLKQKVLVPHSFKFITSTQKLKNKSINY